MINRVCPRCAARNDVKNEFCSACGMSLTPRAKKDGNAKNIVIAVLAGVVLTGVAIAAFQYSLVYTIVSATARHGAPPASASPSSAPTPSAPAPAPQPSEIDPTCPAGDVRSFLANTREVVREFRDDEYRGMNTSRINLTDVVRDLQDTERDYERVEAPECAKAARSATIGAMLVTIQGFISFMGSSSDAGDAASGVWLNASKEEWKRADGELDGLELRLRILK